MRYYKTKYHEIRITKTGIVKNTISGKILKVYKRGSFMLNKKHVNLAKLMIETFKKTKYKNGRIVFLDGNKHNYHIENLEYKTKFDVIEKPNDSDLIKILRFYFGENTVQNIKDVFSFRSQMSTILELRNFYDNYNENDNIEVFKAYFNLLYPSKNNLSKQFGISNSDCRRTIYFFLNKLIEDCKKEKIIN
jgi:hypothetical protein